MYAKVYIRRSVRAGLGTVVVVSRYSSLGASAISDTDGGLGAYVGTTGDFSTVTGNETSANENGNE